MFRVGQKVALVDDRWNLGHGHPDDVRPVQCVTYTVRETCMSFSGHQQIRLCEIRNPVRQYYPYTAELVFGSHRFRPIVERKTDISIFTEILRRESAPSTLAEA